MVDRLLGRHGSGEGHADDPGAAVWAHVQQARNLKRPHTLELLKAMADEFIELHGDRLSVTTRRSSPASPVSPAGGSS